MNEPRDEPKPVKQNSASPPCYAVNDPDSVFSHVAFVWEDASESWQFLCAGRTNSEFRSRVNYWVGKGYEPAQIKEYAVQAYEA